MLAIIEILGLGFLKIVDSAPGKSQKENFMLSLRLCSMQNLTLSMQSSCYAAYRRINYKTLRRSNAVSRRKNNRPFGKDNDTSFSIPLLLSFDNVNEPTINEITKLSRPWKTVLYRSIACANLKSEYNKICDMTETKIFLTSSQSDYNFCIFRTIFIIYSLIIQWSDISDERKTGGAGLALAWQQRHVDGTLNKLICINKYIYIQMERDKDRKQNAK